VRILFSILSIVYITGIFLFAGSPIVQTLAPLNPHSLLHIPLYGILTFLLIFSILPMTQLRVDSPNQTNQRNLSREMRSLFHWDQIDQINQTDQRNQRNSFLLPGFIALFVAIADEIHQAYVPGRDASVTDVLLDLVGIILVLFFISWFLKTKTNAFPH
jgi:VanZ family protein